MSLTITENKLFIFAMRESIEALVATQYLKFTCATESLITQKILSSLRIDELYETMDDEMIHNTYCYKDLLMLSYRLAELVSKVPSSKIKDIKFVEPYFKWEQHYYEFIQEHNDCMFDKNGRTKGNLISCVPKKVMFLDKEIEVDDHFIKTIFDFQSDFLEVASQNDYDENKGFWDFARIDIGQIYQNGGILDVTYGSKSDSISHLSCLPHLRHMSNNNKKDILFVNWHGLWKRLLDNRKKYLQL